MISGQRGRNTYETGDVGGAPITVGQVVGLIHNVPTVKEIIDGIISEARSIMRRLGKMEVTT